MTGEWYYAEGNRQRVGPLPGGNIVELYRSGRIGLDTLVWRDGMGQWQPLGEVAAELGLAAPADGTPPPLPPPPPTPAPAAAAPPRKGLSGCAITAIVLAVIAVVAVPVIGILAAIAIPAYQEYTLRARTQAVYLQVAPLRTQVAENQASDGRCPVNGEHDLGAPESYAGKDLGQVRIGRFDNGHCGIEATFAAPGTHQLDGKALWLDLDPASGEWHCSSEIEDRYLPRECRG